jgi:hypothetical protein
MKNVVFLDIKTQFVLHRRHITSPLQGPAGYCYIRLEVFTEVTINIYVFWNVTPCILPILSTLMMEAIFPSETSVLTRATLCLFA